MMTEDNSMAIPQPTVLRVFARIFSYVFHPLFMPTFIFLWLTIRFPFAFAGITPFLLFTRKITVFWMTAFFPAFSVFLLYQLKFIETIYLRSQKERIVPYIITMIFYWWMWYLSRNFTDQPEVLKFFFFGIFSATIIGLIVNSFFKISMHAMGVGGALMFVILTSFFYHIYLGTDISLFIIIAGVTCSSRLMLDEHGNKEVYAGLFAGILCQVLAYYFAM
jgi:hypothetical protein